MNSSGPVPLEVLEAFGLTDASVEQLSGGRTNHTMRVRAGHDLVLQHLSAEGHSDVLGIMENLVRITSHLDWKHRIGNRATEPSWWPELALTDAAKPFVIVDGGDVWRAFHYRRGRIARYRLDHDTLVSAAALFGRFTEATADADDPPLIVTSPGFHDLAVARADLEAARGYAEPQRVAAVDSVLLQHRTLAGELEQRITADGFDQVPNRVVHNDTKLSNVLLHHSEPRAIAVLDLDLVMAGPAWHDFGDLARSAAWHDGPGDTPRAAIGLFSRLVRAYAGAAPSLTDGELVTFAAAGARLAFELGLRYLADHLRPEPVLRVAGRRAHLTRGEANLNLAAEMLMAYDALRPVVDDLIATRTSHPGETV